ncbi:hypothetical protein SAMN05216262_108137 [Colwellia chukchiensis]|uniref:Uncharacterized protein n=1 Tax=Colwellia chukchiensis TaxID=641665 RepID=A0A1H7NZU7_9GAMM|nr:hypothetical protein [Colwellia chukchiensis]SEL28849.1 hypothetical protein SAMN05216262_108137 [Colwellia chukchiensis]
MSKVNQKNFDVAKAFATKNIENKSDTRVRKTAKRLLSALEEMLLTGRPITPTEIQKFTTEKNKEDKSYKVITAQFLYNDEQKKDKANYIDILNEFIGICPHNKAKNADNEGSDADIIPLHVRTEINTLKRRVETLKNILDQQFNYEESLTSYDIRSMVEAGSSGMDSVDVKAVSQGLSDVQRNTIRTILGALLDREVEVQGQGESERLVDSISGNIIIRPVEYNAIKPLIEEV